MNQIAGPSQREHDLMGLRHHLRSAGMVLAYCDVAGQIGYDTAEMDWLESLILKPRLLTTAVKRAVQNWAAEESPTPTELLPGCHAVAVPLGGRRRRTGYALIITPTVELAESEQFHALCQAVGLDHQTCVRRLIEMRPVPHAELARSMGLAEYLFKDHQRRQELSRTIESVGQQLSESYEEINLLYTMTQSMTVVERPRKFVQTACAGLLETLPYRWIAAQFDGGLESLPALAGALIVSGRSPGSLDDLKPMIDRIVESVQPDAPVVIDPAVQGEHAGLARLGRPILVHPISREGRTLGAFIAADKYGVDQAAASSDLKLLGATASHTSIFLENAALYEDMDAMFVGTLEALSAAIDAKDRYTCGHSQRVAHLAQQLAGDVGLEDHIVRRVHVAGLVHDVGKIGVPESVLSKPGRLTEAEFDLIKQHPEIGHRILKDIPQLRDVLPGVLHHHERWDGKGYPHGLAREDIPLFARLIALADSFDAMSSTRTYRAARDRAWVLREIEQCAGSQFDPELVPVFVRMDFSGFDRLVMEHRAGLPHAQGAEGEAA